MADPAAKSPLRWVWRALWTLAGLLALVLIAAGVGVVMLKGSYGTSLVRDLADGREIGGYGRLDVGPVRGDVLDRFRIETVRVEDEQGVWLEIDDIEIAWSPLSLTAQVLHVQLAEAGAVRVLRRPVRSQASGSQNGAGGPDLSAWRLRLDAAQIERLSLADGVAGPAADLTAEARLAQSDGRWSGAVSAERLDAPGDRLSAAFDFGERLDATFEFDAAPDGVFAEIAGFQGSAVSADGTLGGDLLAGDGEAVLTVDDTSAVRLNAGWSDRRLTVTGEAELSALPGLEGASRRVSGPVSFRVQAPYSGAGITDLDVAQARLDVSSGDLSVTARPRPDRALDIAADLGPGALTLLSGAQASARSVRLEGRLDLSGDRSFEGEISAEDFAAPGGISAGSLSGPVGVSGPAEAPVLRWSLQTDQFSLGVETADRLLGEGPDLAGRAVWRRADSLIVLSDQQIGAAAGTVSAEAEVDLGSARWSVEGRAPRFRPGLVTDLLSGAGPVSVQAQGGFDGAVSLEAQFEGLAPAGALAERLSGPVSGQAVLARQANGALNLERLSVTSPDAQLDATGRREGSAFTVEGDLIWSGAAPVSALTLDGALTARFEAQTGPDGLEARIEARAPALSVGPEPITEARLRLEASGPLEDLTGAARLTGQGGRGSVDLSADFAREGERVALTSLSGVAAGFEIEGTASAGPQALSVSARLSPEAGFGQLDLQAALQGGRFDVTASAEDLVFADLAYLDAAEISVQGPLEDAALSYAAEGAYGAPFDAEGQGRLSLAGETRGLTTSMSGRYGVVALASRTPLEVRFAPEIAVNADLDVGEGRGVLRYAGGSAPSLNVTLEDAPAALLSLRRAREPVQGRLSGDAALTRQGGVWTGEARLRGEALRPARAPQDRTLSGSVSTVLNQERLEVTADASGVQLTASAALSLETGPVSGPGDLTAGDMAVTGSAQADGRIGDFAAFHIDPAQRLEGDIDMQADISGVVSDPVVVGSARLSDGRFADGRAGLDLRALQLELDLTRDGARLTRLSAEDGQGGSLTGQGRLDIATPLGLEADIAFDRFQLIDRDDVQAAGSGEVRFVLEDGQGRVSGSAVIDRADLSPTGTGRAGVTEIEVTEINRPAGLDPAPSRRAGPPIALDYQVSAPRRVFVRGSNYDTEWSFDLAISGTTSDPVLMGEAQLVRGRADLLGRNFDLERGEVILDGDPSQARIDLAAVNQRQDVTARIEVAGAVNDPDVRLTSDPALPEDEVASRILFGQSAANLTALQAAQLGGALASLSGGSGFDPLGALRQAAGLDLLGVRRNAAGDTVVSGGRYLTDDVFLQLEGASAGAAPTTQIEWTLTPRFTLSSSLDAQGRAGLALSWRLEYDDDPFSEARLFRGFRDRLGLGDDDED